MILTIAASIWYLRSLWTASLTWSFSSTVSWTWIELILIRSILCLKSFFHENNSFSPIGSESEIPGARTRTRTYKKIKNLSQIHFLLLPSNTPFPKIMTWQFEQAPLGPIHFEFQCPFTAKKKNYFFLSTQQMLSKIKTFREIESASLNWSKTTAWKRDTWNCFLIPYHSTTLTKKKKTQNKIPTFG